MWPNRTFLDLVGVELPIIQAPMAGAGGAAMAVATAKAGGLGSLPCAMLGADKVKAEVGVIRQQTARPLNLNFFCDQFSFRPARPRLVGSGEGGGVQDYQFSHLGR